MSDAYSILPPLDMGKQGEASPSIPPGHYQQLVSLLEGARNFMGGDPSIMGSLGLMASAIPAGRTAMGPMSSAPRSFGLQSLEPPPALQPLDIKGMNLPAAPVRPGFDAAAYHQAEALRQQLGVSSRTPGSEKTDAALKAIQEALALVPRQFR